MRLSKKMATGIMAGILALSMTACSSTSVASSANIAALVNSSSSYTVSSFDSVSSDTVSLIKEAVETYANYKNCLTNTTEYSNHLKNTLGYSSSDETYKYSMKLAKAGNVTAKNNFAESLASFNARGIGSAYAITTDEVADLNDDTAVASYVASLLTGDATVYVSDVIDVPVLDDDEGTYTGNCTHMRYVYIQYAN